jgi:FkbH-like protein/FkbM family methyltransferase
LKSARIDVGLRSAPCLADHAVQESALLPGSFYVTAALRLQRELFQGDASRVRKAVFHAPVVLSTEDTRIEVEATPCEDGSTRYVFRETPGQRHAATLEVEPAVQASAVAAPFLPESIRARAQSKLDSRQYYAALDANGNQYGPRFQGITTLWRAGDESLGFINVPDGDPGLRQTILLDSLTQMLASFGLERGGTFVLRSIEAVEGDCDARGGLWGHATLRARDGTGDDYLGDIQAFDQSNAPVLKLTGVAFVLAEQAHAPANLVVAANFTAEPLADSLRFWGAHLGLPLRTTFAPYNQVFQQLLDPGSALGRNRDGVNVVLLALEEWAVAHDGARTLSDARADECFAGLERTRLPNGLQVAHLNAHETGYLYEEIFEDQCYLRHGIVLEEGDTVVDIGANIGLFSLFVHSRCPGARLFAFEPAPRTFEALRANCAAHAPGAKVFNAGVSDKPGTATLTVYGKATVFSGFHAQEQDDRAALRAIVSNMLRRESAEGEALEDYADELTADRLQRTEHECRLTSISDFMREQGIGRINLLKIDAEKSEFAILAGIREEDWPKIDQLVVEVHDQGGDAAERVLQRLRERGYRCSVEQAPLLRDAGLCSVYGTRRVARSQAEPVAAAAAANLRRNVREFVSALRACMQRATVPLVLCICPRNPAALAARAPPAGAVEDAERALLLEAGAISNVHVLAPDVLARQYPIGNVHDPESATAGHVPYTPEGYAALGTALMRTLYRLKSRPRKVIALDCDNTLWTGVCGEDGPAGIGIGEARRRLQEFMIAQMQAGMLLCLCSKNNEHDVLRAFEQHGDMPLKLPHFAARRVNWRQKPENLESLAAELGVGLDSFILVDDDPLECASMRRRCPAVLTLQLPREEAEVGAFLDHAWAFDRSAATDEDRSRTQMVKENALRRRFGASVTSLRDFIEGLELRIDIAPVAEPDLARVAQLIARTNQFSLVAQRRSEGELRQFLKRPAAGCAAVRVADRFGDYGLVGAALYERADRCLRIDSFLLSCRALGRGVEHAMAAWLGRMAQAEGLASVEFAYRPTDRNQPAQDFIAGIGGPAPGNPGMAWRLAAQRLSAVAYTPTEPTPQAAPASRTPQPAARAGWDLAGVDSERMQRIAQELRSIDRVIKAIEAGARTPASAVAPQAAPAGSLEAALADVWARVLGRPVGLNENFFDAGGTSLKAVRVVALVKKELGRSLQVVSLLECPTVASLAARLEGAPAAAAPAAGEAARRGQLRRQLQTTGLRTA